MRRTLIAASMIPVVIFTTPALAWLEAGCANQNYSASQVADAIKNSSTANQTLKDAACDFGGAARAESGGNSCERNSANFGVLQLNVGNLPPGMSANEYLNKSLQEQVDIWARQVGNSNTTGGYATLSTAVNNGSTIGGATPTAGMLAACFQFGPAICRNDIAFMQANGGACPTSSNGGININSLPRSQWGSANLDGNGQSICSWGRSIQNQINNAAAECKNQSASCGPGDFPNTQTTAIASAAPPPAATDILVNDGQV